jgi:hypothetical protein
LTIKVGLIGQGADISPVETRSGNVQALPKVKPPSCLTKTAAVSDAAKRRENTRRKAAGCLSIVSASPRNAGSIRDIA